MLQAIIIALLIIALTFSIFTLIDEDIVGSFVFDNTISIGNIIEGILVAALVIVTSYYAITTRKTLSAVNRSTEVSVKPHIKCSMAIIGTDTLFLKVSNVGVGSALNVNLEYSVESIDNSNRSWTSSVILPKESYRFYIKNEQDVLIGLTYCSQNQTTIKVVGTYNDILTKEHPIDETINVTDISQKLLGSGQMKRIDHIEEIDHSLKDIKDNLRFIRHDFRHLARRSR